MSWGKLDWKHWIKLAQKVMTGHGVGAAFDGISAVGINAYNDIFASAPTIMLKGETSTPATGLPHPNFKTAQVEAVLDSTGKLSSVRVLDPGAYYYSTP